MTNDGRKNEDEEDHKATLWHDLEKEMKQIFEQFFKEPKQSTKLTRKNWEDEFNNKLVDWNSPRFIQSNQPVRDVKEFIKQLLEDITEEEK